MTTSELQAEIETTKQRLQAARTRSLEICEEIEAATVRQRLRRELEELKVELDQQQTVNVADEDYKRSIDADDCGMFVDSAAKSQPVWAHRKNGVARDACTNFGHQILKGEFTWKLLPMSWLQTALRHEGKKVAKSDIFSLGEFVFSFVYSPSAGPVIMTTACGERPCGSLAIVAYGCAEPIALRYSIYAKRSTGDFVQWGATQDEIHHSANEVKAYGPDVHPEPHPEGSPPQEIGVFGLTHEQLLQSELVQDDTLRVKLVLEVRELGIQVTSQRSEREAVDVPNPTLHRDVQALFEEATSGDVQFRLQDEVIHAHSQVLCARSEVLKKLLNSGMQESTSKVIMVEDCTADAFKAFLTFLYTDNFPFVEGPAAKQSRTDGSLPLPQMEALWAVSHKYQVERLQRWCEAQLCKQLSAERVCDILRQAHVFEATQLEKACLSYIKENCEQVLRLQAYSSLMSKWPEVALKIHLFTAGVSESQAAAIVQARKVRRLNDGAERTS
ncbi:BPM6 [Symbiodinium sp. CCMP2592]|nr:BPM6 [Symbiodinium sp. CCMP2592]